jgi:hypothetical protein
VNVTRSVPDTDALLSATTNDSATTGRSGSGAAYVVEQDAAVAVGRAAEGVTEGVGGGVVAVAVGVGDPLGVVDGDADGVAARCVPEQAAPAHAVTTSRAARSLRFTRPRYRRAMPPTDLPSDLWTAILAVDNAVADAVKRVRRRSAGWWRDDARDAGLGRTRADAVAGLVGRLATAGQALEGRVLPHRTPPRPLRDPVLADQLVVVGRDLVDALGAAGDAGAAASALADVERTVRAVDPR